MKARLLDLLSSFDVISFDVFDTLRVLGDWRDKPASLLSVIS